MKREEKIWLDYRSGKSIDLIVGLNVCRGWDKDRVLKVIRDGRWTHYQQTGEKI